MRIEEALRALARHRTDEVVVTCMSAVRPWGRLGAHPLDFASADSAMGHTADFALGLALARPERRVVCLNGDGSMLMTLGTLVTIAEAGAGNLILMVLGNGTYEITGNQEIPAQGALDLTGMARAAGFRRCLEVTEASDFDAALPELLTEPGPTFVELRVEPGSEGPISRSSMEQAPYLQVSLEVSAHRLREAL